MDFITCFSKAINLFTSFFEKENVNIIIWKNDEIIKTRVRNRFDVSGLQPNIIIFTKYYTFCNNYNGHFRTIKSTSLCVNTWNTTVPSDISIFLNTLSKNLKKKIILYLYLLDKYPNDINITKRWINFLIRTFDPKFEKYVSNTTYCSKTHVRTTDKSKPTFHIDIYRIVGFEPIYTNQEKRNMIIRNLLR